MGRAKRAMTGRLPANWRQAIWAEIQESNHRFRDAIAVLELTGCRPSELESGVEVSIDEDVELGTILTFRIFGAKVGQVRGRNGEKHDRGQPERKIAVALTSPCARHLFKRVAKDGKLTIKYHRKSISNRISEISKALYPRRREHVSAYCYRHAFGTDLKNTVSDAATRAAALGHLSDYSQRSYGRPSGDKRGAQSPPIVSVDPSREVKHSKKTDRLLRFKIAAKNRKV